MSENAGARTGARTIAHFFPSFSFGGQQRRLGALVDAFGPAFSHRIYALDGDVSARTLVNSKFAAVAPLKIKKTSIFDGSNFRLLQRTIKESSADLLCTYNWGSIEAVLANRLGPKLPHVHHEDGFGPDEGASLQKRPRVFARRALLKKSTVVVPSRALEKIALDIWRLEPASLRRIGIGVDLSQFSRAPRNTAEQVAVVSIGALRPEKNFARLIRCFAKANVDHAAELAIYGEGPQAQLLRELSSASTDSGRIRLPGSTAEPHVRLAAADIFALSSDTEQTPISLAEAMASSLPAVVTDVGDIRLMLSDENQPFIFSPDDEEGFATGLRTLIGDPNLRERIGLANKRKSTEFELDKMAGQFASLYRSAMESG